MATAVNHLFVSRADYLAGELLADQKHEYVAGAVYAMAGGKANHQRVSLGFLTAAANELRGKPCEPFGSDFLVRVPLSQSEEAFYYPDGMIVCEPVGGDDRFTEVPVVILEVLSESTRRNDEVQKLRDYLTLPSLQVYLLAEADEPTIRIYRRTKDGFIISVVQGMDAVLELPEVGLTLPLSELYRDVTLDESLTDKQPPTNP